MLLFITLFCNYYLSIEHPAYIWDWGGHFRIYQHFGHLMIENPQVWLWEVGKSIRNDDYNVSSVALLFPIHNIFGPGREGYIFSIVFLYLVPAAFISASLSLYAARQSGIESSRIIVGVLSVFFPAFWQSTLRGMPDIVGLIPLSAATLLILKSRFLTRFNIHTAIFIGILIWSAFLFRRWYAYAGLSLILCTSIAAFIVFIQDRERRIDIFKNHFFGMSAVSLCIVFLLYFFQRELVERIMSTNYADLYVAYQAPFAKKIIMIFQRIGLFYSVMVAVGLWIAVVKKSTAVLFMTLVACTTFLLFSLTQAPGPQHGLPVYLWLLPTAMLGVQWLLSLLRSPFRTAFSLAFVLLGLTIFLVSFLPTVNAALRVAAPLAPWTTFFPLYVENYPEYQRLIEELRHLTVQGDKFAVFASSKILSDSLIDALDQKMQPAIEWVSHVDERDGLALQPLRARFAVVANPVPLHLPQTSQRVIAVPAQHIIAGTDFGSAYRRVSGPFALAGDHIAYIYERNRQLSEDDIRQLEAELSGYHKGWIWDKQNRIFTASMNPR